MGLSLSASSVDERDAFIVERQPVLDGLPVLANIDFGHINPLATLPLGGRVEVIASDAPRLRILDH